MGEGVGVRVMVGVCVQFGVGVKVDRGVLAMVGTPVGAALTPDSRSLTGSTNPQAKPTSPLNMTPKKMSFLFCVLKTDYPSN